MQGERLNAPPAGGSEMAGDVDLMTAVVRGERPALARLYDRHADVLLALALRFLGDRAQAEDLLHDVFLEAWHHARDFDAARGTVRAWLVTRMRSRALDRRASRARQARLADQLEQVPTVTTQDGGAGLDAERIRRHVAGLGPELVAVLELAYFEGASSSEIASKLGIPIGTVKSRMARALETLRQAMGATLGNRL